MGQLETDEVYVGLDKRGVHFVFPVQAKGGRDQISPIQIQQDLAMCREKFPALICRPLGAQFISAKGIALFEFEEQDDDVRVASEKHYRLVAPDELTVEEIRSYRQRLPAPGSE